MSESNKPSDSAPSQDQPAPAAAPAPSPATLALREARGLFMQNFVKSLPKTAQGQIVISPQQLIELLRDSELESMRISSLASVLVAKGLISAEELAAEAAVLIQERAESLGAEIVVARLRGGGGRINGG